eukprot:7211646-Alexandrium_andersonii.AAC.1
MHVLTSGGCEASIIFRSASACGPVRKSTSRREVCSECWRMASAAARKNLRKAASATVRAE